MATKSNVRGNGSGKPAANGGVPHDEAAVQEIECWTAALLSKASRFRLSSVLWAAGRQRDDYRNWLESLGELYDHGCSDNSQAYSRIDKCLKTLKADGHLLIFIGVTVGDFTRSCHGLIPEKGHPLMSQALMHKSRQLVAESVMLSALLRHAAAGGQFAVSADFRSKAKMIDEKTGGELTRRGLLT